MLTGVWGVLSACVVFSNFVYVHSAITNITFPKVILRGHHFPVNAFSEFMAFKTPIKRIVLIRYHPFLGETLPQGSLPGY